MLIDLVGQLNTQVKFEKFTEINKNLSHFSIICSLSVNCFSRLQKHTRKAVEIVDFTLVNFCELAGKCLI